MRARRGVALPAAVLVLAIVVLFVAGSAFAATQEARASVGALAERTALEAAEYGASAVLRDWDRAWNVSTRVGQTLGPFTHNLQGGAVSTVRLTRTSTTLWWVVSTGAAGGALARRAARRTVSALYRLDLPPSAVGAALAVTDSARVTGTGAVTGTDSIEALVGCPFSATPTAGVAAPDTMRVCDGGCGATSGRITGTPPLLPDSSVSSSVTILAASLTPDIVLAPGTVVTPTAVVTAGVCDTLAAANWGDPNGGACQYRLPVVRALGDVTVHGGTGQGIIVANGDVTFEAGAFFTGLIVAADDFFTGAGGGSVLGAVLAGDLRRGSADHSVVGNGGRIRRSTCRVQQARLASASPIRVRQRWWAEFD